MKNLHGIIVLGLITLSACTTGRSGAFSGVMVDELVTPSYEIRINSDCGFDCKDLSFFVQNRVTGSKKTLKGEKLIRSCNGYEPGEFCQRLLGYRFKDGPDTYYITESGRLTITRDYKTVLWERGDWEEEGGAGQ